MNVDRMRKYNRKGTPRITRDGNSHVPQPAVIVIRDAVGNEIRVP